MKKDELNILADKYYSVMDISDEKKKKRKKDAWELFDLFMLFFLTCRRAFPAAFCMLSFCMAFLLANTLRKLYTFSERRR